MLLAYCRHNVDTLFYIVKFDWQKDLAPLQNVQMTYGRKKSAAQGSVSSRAKSSARERIYNYVHELVSKGELRGGHVISELQLSRDLGTSRSPVREAIGHLIADGLLEQAPNRSAVVVDLHREDIIDLYEVREALETYAVRKVAQRGLHPANDAQLKGYLASVQDMIRSVKKSGKRELNREQMAEFSSIDMKFHALLVLSTRNVRMQKIVADTRVLVRIFAMRRNGHELSVLEKIHRQHVAIAQAVVKGHAEDAAALLSEHIQTSLQERLEEFDLWKRESAMRNHPLTAEKAAKQAAQR
jgi:DNA-binding GntR family transcriptional regulator